MPPPGGWAWLARVHRSPRSEHYDVPDLAAPNCQARQETRRLVWSVRSSGRLWQAPSRATDGGFEERIKLAAGLLSLSGPIDNYPGGRPPLTISPFGAHWQLRTKVGHALEVPVRWSRRGCLTRAPTVPSCRQEVRKQVIRGTSDKRDAIWQCRF